MPLRFERGDATAPVGGGPRTIVHVCNDCGRWGRGFVLALSKRWAAPERAYRAWSRGETMEPPFELGAVQFVEVEPTLFVANLVGQEGIRPKAGVPPVRYDAIERGLATVSEHARTQSANVHMPRIGCGLAGGTWDRIEPCVDRTLLAVGLEVFVYDWP